MPKTGAANMMEKAIYMMLKNGLWPGGVFHVGKTFFVNGTTGSNANDGKTPATAWLTITYALGQCTAFRDDVIYVIDCWDQEPAWPITVNIERVHIIGVANPIGQYPKMQPNTNNPVFLVTAAGQYSEIAGFDLGGWNNVGNTSGCIHLDNAISTWIHHCVFGSIGAGGVPQDGIRFVAGNSRQTLIEDCCFYGTGADGLITRDGILLNFGNNFHTILRNNILNGLAGGIAVHLASNADDVTIKDNVIACDCSAVNGTGITLEAVTARCLVVGNKAMYLGGPLAPAFNAYRDLGASHWGINHVGIAPVFPVLV